MLLGLFKNKNKDKINELKSEITTLKKQLDIAKSNTIDDLIEKLYSKDVIIKDLKSKVIALEQDNKCKDVTIKDLEGKLVKLQNNGKKRRVIEDEDIIYIGLNSYEKNLNPVELIIGEDKIDVYSWKDVYRNFVNNVSLKYSNFDDIVDKSLKLGKVDKVIVSRYKSVVTVVYTGKKGDEHKIYEPYKLDKGLYLESPALSSYTILQRLNAICDCVNIPIDIVKIGVLKND